MKIVFRSLALTLALVAVAGLFAALPADANINSVTVVNKSDHCAWITIYWAPDRIMPYMIARGNAAPRFLRAGESARFATGDVGQMKVRAEVKNGPGCEGHTIRDTYDVRENGDGDQSAHLNAHLVNSREGFNMWFY